MKNYGMRSEDFKDLADNLAHLYSGKLPDWARDLVGESLDLLELARPEPGETLK